MLCALSGIVFIALTVAVLVKNVLQSYEVVSEENRLMERAANDQAKWVTVNGHGQTVLVAEKEGSTPAAVAGV